MGHPYDSPEAVSQSDLLSQLRIDRRAPEPAPRRRWPWVLTAASVAVVLLGWLLWGRAPAAKELEMATAVAAASAPVRGSVLDASGYVIARRQATVSSKVTGRVVEVLIEEGMRVEAGQVLARLDDSQQQADLALRRAQLDAARAQLGELEALLRQARADLARQQELHERGLASAAALDAARAQSESLMARLASARSQIGVAERTLALSGVALEDTVIRAPFDGIVIAKAAQPGEMISPVSAGGGFTRTGIGTLVDMDSLEIEVEVNEAFIGRVSAGMPVAATLNAYPDWKIPGSVIAVIPAADRTKATVPVRVAIGQRDPRIVPDMGVRVAFLEQEASVVAEQAAVEGVVLPATALAQRDGETVVFVYDGQRVQRRDVVAGERRGGTVVVRSGVAAGETVVLNPPADLAEGDPVRRRGAGRG